MATPMCLPVLGITEKTLSATTVIINNNNNNNNNNIPLGLIILSL